MPQLFAQAPVETVEDVVWPAWGFDEGLDQLAKYVSPVALARTGLNDADAVGEPEIPRDRYERLREEGIRYALEPYVPPRWKRQQVRDPRLLLRAGVGTCLDLATAYAGMCLDALVAPLLAVGNGHASVLLHLGAYDGHVDGRPPALPGTRPHPQQPGVLAVADLTALLEAVDQAAVVAVDAVKVTDGDLTFEDACQHGRRHLGPGTRLVDVVWLHGNGVAPLASPTRAPGIRPYVPGGRVAMTQYRGRALPSDALPATGMVVLHGDSGTGKTTIARAVAVDEPQAAGWVLNASSRETLIDSLAQAELAQRDIRVEDLDDQLREGYAYAALDRLRAADDPWVVVLDNADGSPRELRGLLPRPSVRQRLIVTTTNGREWPTAPRVTHDVRLEPLSEAAVLAELDGDAGLAAATEGLPLVLEAYRSFLAVDDPATAALTRLQALREATAERRGAAALWHALEDVGALADRELLCAVAALMPPDRVPVDVAERLGDVSPGAVEALSRSGLFQWDGDAARLHRLFGAAVRAALDTRSPAVLDRAAVAIATDSAALAHLDRHGDPITIRSLERRLSAIDTATRDPALELGRALHGLAAVLELKGDASSSAALYERAERHLRGGSPEELVMLAECLHGRARLINQRFTRDEPLIRAALEWVREAQRLQEQANRPDGVGKSRALEGLLLQKTAAFTNAKVDKLAILAEARRILEEAHELRARRLPDGHHELLRSEFNLAGNRIELAKLERPKADMHLASAADVYQHVHEGRSGVYDRKHHPHIAACRNGLGIVHYYRALYVASTAEDRTDELRKATVCAEDALAQRQAFDGDEDLADTQKSLALLGKILVARTALPLRAASTLHVRAPDARHGPRPYFEEVDDELRDVLVFRDVPPLALGGDAVAHAEEWFASPVLASLCARLGVPMASDGTLAHRLTQLADDTAPWAATEVAGLLGQYDEMAIEAASRALGLHEVPPPPETAFDALVVCGGAVRDCLARASAVKRDLGGSRLAAPLVIGVAAPRPLDGPERDVLERLGRPAARHEAEVLHTALAGPAEAMADVLVVPPAEDPADLAGAALRAMADRGLATPRRLCLVTSMHERAAALARAVARAPREVAIDAIGIDAGKVDYRLAHRPTATAMLRQLHETVAAYRDMVRAHGG